MKKAIRVLVIEDNRLARDRLTALLNAQRDFRVMATVREPAAGLLRVQETKPHVVFVGASLGNRSSHGVVARLHTTHPDVRVIVVDLRPVTEDVVAFVRAGASGFLPRSATSNEIVATVRSVATGATVVPPPFTSALFSYLATGSVGRSTRAASGAAGLSNRERVIMGLLAEGLSNKDIARRLGIVVATVKSNVHKILARLGLRNRVQIAAYVNAARQSRTESPSPRRSLHRR